MSKKKKQEEEEGPEGPRCPMCREKLLFGPFETLTVKITQVMMTVILNTFGGCDDRFKDPNTGLFVAPQLEKGMSYATHPDFRGSVALACKFQGPHHCQSHACVRPFCNNSLTLKGCQCGSLTSEKKQLCRNATWGKEGEQQASGADECRKTKVKKQMPAPPAPAAPAPAPPAPAPEVICISVRNMSSMYECETIFRGTCFLDSDDEWYFHEKKVKTTAFGKHVYFANEEDDEEILGVITNHIEIDGWCISGKNIAGEERETWIPDLSLEPVYLVTDPIPDPITDPIPDPIPK